MTTDQDVPILTASDLTKEFGGLTALDRVEFSIERGELVSLIGPNGAGKSTLINTITGLLEPTNGEVYFAGSNYVETGRGDGGEEGNGPGINITGMNPFEITQLGIGRSFQTASIFPELTVRENVEIAAFATEHGSFRVNFFRRRDSYEAVRQRTDEILETLRIEEDAHLNAESLPYGEKRRLEVAIGLATDPDLMFMDEPTAGMTPAETEMTVSLIRELLDEWGMTILLVEHDMDVVFDVSDRILTLHQGELIAQGTPEEIRNDPIVREAYLGGEAE